MSDFRGFSEIEINGGDNSNNSEKQGKEINTKYYNASLSLYYVVSL